MHLVIGRLVGVGRMWGPGVRSALLVAAMPGGPRRGGWSTQPTWFAFRQWGLPGGPRGTTSGCLVVEPGACMSLHSVLGVFRGGA